MLYYTYYCEGCSISKVPQVITTRLEVITVLNIANISAVV
jgi:hypothetical protein